MQYRVPPSLAESWQYLYPEWFRVFEWEEERWSVTLTGIYDGDIWVNQEDGELNDPDAYQLLVIVDGAPPVVETTPDPNTAVTWYSYAVDYLRTNGPYDANVANILTV